MIVSRKIAEMFKHPGFVNIDYLVENKLERNSSKILNILNRDWRKWVKPVCTKPNPKTLDPLDPTYTWQVGQSSDDCRRRLVPSEFSLTENFLGCGDDDSDFYDYSSGFRFTNLIIPQGTTINSAYLKLKARLQFGTIAETFIEGQDSDNATTFSDAADYDGRTRTTACVSWTPAEWVQGTWYTSSDIKTVIKEIIDRAGWASGNALALFWRDAAGYGGAGTTLYTYSYDTADPPQLEVTWTEPPKAPKGTIAIHAKILDIV